jgi:xanthine dehydrogenase YagR molybdenum-binding subunit
VPDYSWPPMDKRQVMGKRLNRLDGVAKASGKAKYSSDLNPDGLLYGVLLTSPHAHCNVKSIDVTEAKAVPGVTSVRIINGPGKEIQWRGAEIASVAATSELAALDAVRKIKVEYEILPHLVKEAELSKAGARARPAGEQVSGDPEKAFAEADAISEGIYGIPVITHCCLEPHGQVVRWSGENIDYWPSTQNVSAVGGDLAKSLGVPVTNVSVDMQYMGGGFGSKFPADLWASESANHSKESGGKPVKMFLDRATELSIAGNRPSVYGKVKVAAKSDGTITAWQSETWGSGGMTGGGLNADLFPYVFRQIPNRKVNHTAVSLNMGSARAWRAPNHPQQAYITFSALEDLSAKLKMDPIDFFLKNIGTVNQDRRPAYERQIAKGMELIDWKKNWHQRGDSGKGQWKQGMGVGFCTWGGLGHDSKCRTTINPDGTVEVEIGSQDIGTAARTMIAMVTAETTGVDYTRVRVKLGDNHYPTSGASGGSTTTGGVSVSSRKAAVNALDKLFEKIAPLLNTTPDQLEARDNTIRVKGDPSRSISWTAACQKLGIEKITEMGENIGRNASKEGLITQGVAGVQMAEVLVDVETGVVKMSKLVIVQDCGLVVNPKTCESQAYGAGIMTICAALMEERITDQTLGSVLNADMEFYKLASINDIGEIIVHLDIHPDMDKRGIIGVGEPLAVGGLAAIGNAVANAIGVRVPSLPLTPNRVLAALSNKGNGAGRLV